MCGKRPVLFQDHSRISNEVNCQVCWAKYIVLQHFYSHSVSPFCQAPQSPERLRCYYKTGHPLCTIKRCPIEVVFTNPDIMIFHQLMSNAEIDKVITISKPLVRIVRAIVFYCQSTFVSLLLSVLSLYLAPMT